MTWQGKICSWQILHLSSKPIHLQILRRWWCLLIVKLKELKVTSDKTFLRTRLVWWHWVPGCPWQRRTGWKESLSPFMSCKQRYWVERKLNLFMSCYHRSNLQSVGEEDGDAEHGQGCLCQWSALWHHLLKRRRKDIEIFQAKVLYLGLRRRSRYWPSPCSGWWWKLCLSRTWGSRRNPCQCTNWKKNHCFRDGWRYQNGWYFGKVP